MTGCRFWPGTQVQASYKSIPFEVDIDVKAGGRRVITHEYPSRENWDNEDLGKLHQRFQVFGYVFGDDADARAEALFAACTSQGPGLLLLPVRSPVTARCSFVESTFVGDEMGRIPFTMTFIVESSGIGGIFPDFFLRGKVIESADDMVDCAVYQFDTRFSSLDVPAVARDAAATAITLAADALDGARRAVRMDDDSAALVRFNAGLIRSSATDFSFGGQRPERLSLDTFVADQDRASSGFAQAFASSIDIMSEAAVDPRDMIAAMDGLMTFEPQSLPSFTIASVAAERELTGQVQRAVRRVALAGKSKATAGIVLRSKQEAVAARAGIAVDFIAEIDLSEDPDCRKTIVKGRDAVVDFLSRRGAELPPVVRKSYAYRKPAAVIATELYGDSRRDRELMDRNASYHALYMPVEIEALAK